MGTAQTDTLGLTARLVASPLAAARTCINDGVLFSALCGSLGSQAHKEASSCTDSVHRKHRHLLLAWQFGVRLVIINKSDPVIKIPADELPGFQNGKTWRLP